MRRIVIACISVLLAALPALSQPPGDCRDELQPLCHHLPPVHMEIASNKPWVQVRVNDAKPLWFVLDTGNPAVSFIDTARAKELGLKIENERKVRSGAGEGVTTTVGSTRGVTLETGGRKVTNQTISVVDVSHVSEFEGRHLNGTLGGAFFSRYTLEIDYPGRTVQFHDARTYRYAGPGVKIPITFLNGLVTVKAAVTLPGGEPIEANFVVDTGARTALIFNSSFVAKHKLLEKLDKKFLATIGGGVGGESRGYVSRIESLKIGSILTREPVTVFSTDKSGVLASRDFAGIIGGGVLKRCRVVFDYANKALILEPSSRKPGRYEYDMSGMFLTAEGPKFRKFKVMSVVEGSPAAVVGLRRGDIITTINGRKAARFTLERIRRMFLREGREFRLEIQRGEKKIQVTFKTRRLI
jgi:hypothetical protein